MKCSDCGYDGNTETDLACNMCRAVLPRNGAVTATIPQAPVCTGCGRKLPRHLARCQICGAPTPGPKGDRAREGLRAGLGEIVREQIREGAAQQRRARRARIIDAVFFLLMAPIAVPSIVMTALQAKRWGRIPVAMVVFDAVVIFALSPLLAAMLGFSSAAAGWFYSRALFTGIAAFCVLAIRRGASGKLDQGIFLGYSNLTLLPLIAGGILFAMGSGRILSSGPKPEELRLIISADAVRRSPAQALTEETGGVHPHIVLADARLDSSRTAFRVEKGGGPFLAQDPANIPVVPAKDLVAQPQDYLGRCVAIQARLDETGGFWLEERWRELPDYVRASGVEPGRRFDEVSTGKRGELWLISPAFPSAVSAGAVAYGQAHDSVHVGTVVKLDPLAVRRLGFTSTVASPLGVIACPLSAPEDIARCAPVEGTDQRLWVTWRSSAPPAELRGILETPDELGVESLAALVRAGGGPAFTGAPRVLVAASPEEFRSLRGLGPAPPPHSAGGRAWAMLALGAVALAGAVWLAARE